MASASRRLLAATLLLAPATALAADRADLFDAQGRRQGYAVIDRERVDFYDTNSRRTGYGKLAPDGKVERFGLDGRRQGETAIPPDRRDRAR